MPDNLNRLSTVTIDWVVGRPSIRYICDDANRLDRIEHFNAMETDYTWDVANRLTGIAHNGPTNLAAYSLMLRAKHLRLPD